MKLTIEIPKEIEDRIPKNLEEFSNWISNLLCFLFLAEGKVVVKISKESL